MGPANGTTSHSATKNASAGSPEESGPPALAKNNSCASFYLPFSLLSVQRFSQAGCGFITQRPAGSRNSRPMAKPLPRSD